MHHCKKCGHEWDARVKDPKTCPRCKRYLDVPVRQKKPESEVIPIGPE